MEWLLALLAAGIGFALGRQARDAGPARVAETTAAPVSEPTSTTATTEEKPPDVAVSEESPRDRVWRLARALESRLEQIEDTDALEHAPEFRELVDVLCAPPFDPRERADLAPSSTLAMSCAAIAAMTRQHDAAQLEIARITGRLGWFSLTFALRYLATSADPAVASTLFARASPWWLEHPPTRSRWRACLDAFAAQGVDRAGFAPDLAEIDDPTERIELVRRIEHPVAEAYVRALREAARARELARSIDRVGRWLEPVPEGEDPAAHTPDFDALVATLVDTLEQPTRPSFVALGEPGCGKTTAIRAALALLAARGWRVLEATAEQIVAGQKYVGEIEQRVESLIEALSAPRTLWYAPACHTLLERGTWSGNPNGLLDSLLPALEARRIQMVGESERSAWAMVAAQRPRAAILLRSVTFEPTDAAQTRALIDAWAAQWQRRLGARVLEPALAQEAIELARQHFPDRAEPGRTLALLDDALGHARAETPPTLPLTRDALLAALSKRSGIPVDVLDVERRLDMQAIRAFFTDRVMGQDEAVDTLVDRIAMLKAGLTDPRRPLGVFLFAGPTGTGKTEIAKTLAELLFGSPDRMLRFDMSEYQGDDAAWRLIDDGGQRRSASLTTRIREQPFSVVLLDEFEKAHPRVWDLFLQVFDDGRLTDRAGSTVSFRHAIVILTSNLGATIDRGGGPGFVAGAAGMSRALVQRAIDATFRREFINRIDQVVIFAPLSRAVMRDILQKELRSVLARRGFQVRDWAVEWEPSAIDFLLQQGFTVDLGARPLRRAIERHVLAPLARSIVEHRAPSGEQFLFVSSDGARIEVRFVDPDAPVAGSAPEFARAAPADVRALALDPRADAAALRLLRETVAALRERSRAPGFEAQRERGATAMQDVAFWQRPDRALVLDQLERIDRIESGLRSAASLLERLARATGRSVLEPLRRLALLLHVLGEAIASIEQDEPEHARLTIVPRGARGARADAWRDRLRDMYLAWARARGMRAAAGPPRADGAVTLEIGGFGAWRLLREEAGLHLLGSDGADERERHGALVEVAAEPAGSRAPDPAREPQVVRRYSDAPVPLVRDAVRGWRTGRAERVFDGDFDLISAE
jgi:ATP-dependent Clp protease ATP-binding subunit ClpC